MRENSMNFFGGVATNIWSKHDTAFNKTIQLIINYHYVHNLNKLGVYKAYLMYEPVWSVAAKFLLVNITAEQFHVSTATVKLLFMLDRKLKN